MDISAYLHNLKFEINALLFDWGNTVMKVFPDYTGPMANWPEVAAIDGIPEILPVLKQKFKIILTSDAQDSDQNLVRQALERVNLALYFDAIFTPVELNERKPAPRFYLKILNQIGIEPENGIMIGEDYEKDIIAAKQVGLWTIWYNAAQKRLQNNSYPYHNAEVIDPREIIAVLQKQFI